MPPKHELYHEIFGSILDRTEMTPYLLLRATNYQVGLTQASRMLANRGFDSLGSGRLRAGEKTRAQGYTRRARRYLLDWLLPFVEAQLRRLAKLGSANRAIYRSCLRAVAKLRAVLDERRFMTLVDEDPRHLLLLASSRRYPRLFHGYQGSQLDIPARWQRLGCAMLKTAHLVKAIEEDSREVHEYAELGVFFERHGRRLDDLLGFDWVTPKLVPEEEPAQRAFVKLAMFFHKLRESMGYVPARGGYVFNSGDGVEVEIAEVKARLKSPESMFTKLGKNREGEVHDIRDILAVTFLLKSREDTLTLFHALQKQGVILQENTVSPSITQTLFSSPEDMLEAVRRLSVNLARSEGSNRRIPLRMLRAEAQQFFRALSIHAKSNPDSALGHRKFQCKINFSVPIHRDAASDRILIPGTAAHATRATRRLHTEQHTLAVELRITDLASWRASEWSGQSHHDAYRCRQLLALTNRIFAPQFHFPTEALPQLRADQDRLFAAPAGGKG